MASTQKDDDSRPSSSKQILNDKQVPVAPIKELSISIAKTSSSPDKGKQINHYVLHTIKGESDNTEGDNINFTLAVNDEEEQGARRSIKTTEELHLSGDDGENSKTQEIVEHVCGKCYKTFRRFNGLKKHLDFCRFDSGYHLRKAEMQKNLEKIEKDGIVMENKDVCFCCGESYDTFHLGHINCPDCPKSFKTQMSYERHIFITHSEHDDFPCNICNAKLRSVNLLKLHVEQHQNRGKPYACKICGKDFTRSYHLKRHQKYSLCSADANDAMHCKVCNKVYFRLDNLRAHLKHHLGTRSAKKVEYMCPICKNCFYSLSTLNIHTRTHTGERPFDCDLCIKKFPSLVALKKHRRYHTGEKPYTCSVCNQTFAVKEVLNRHMKRHTGERPHVCNECGKSFIQATQLKNHIPTHIRPFECKYCKEKFKTEKQLLRHAKVHNAAVKRRQKAETEGAELKEEEGGEPAPARKMRKPRAVKAKQRTDCAICEKNFDTVKSLQFHILKVHEVDPEEFVNEKNDTADGSLTQSSAEIYKIEESTPPRKKRCYKKEKITPTNTGHTANENNNGGGLVVQEFIIDELNTTNDKETIFIENEAFTVIPLDSNGLIEHVTTHIMPEQISPDADQKNKNKKTTRKTLAESLAAAIADNDDNAFENDEVKNMILNEEDAALKEKVGKLLDMLVDKTTLLKFGWPQTTEESVLCQVIENCGHDLTKENDTFKDCDYAARMREYVKLLFTVVIQNDSIRELLNNYPIDEVIDYVLCNDDEDDDSEEKDDNGTNDENKSKSEKDFDSNDKNFDSKFEENDNIGDNQKLAYT